MTMDATDRAILVALLPFEASAPHVARALYVAHSTVYRHLPALESAGLVRSRWDAEDTLDPLAPWAGSRVYRLTARGRVIAEGLQQASLGLAGVAGDGVATDDGAGDCDATDAQG